MKVGDRLGRFELQRELGRGSHGVVFEATDVLLGERVAIKALQPWLAGDVTLRERFKRELVLTRRVSHPGVARLHDLHEENGILFISMQYVEGKSLSQILRAGLPSEERVIHILRGVCGALAAAHAEGVIHRDLKPANIMVTDQDKVIVLDFGIATATGVGQLTRPGEAMGSVPYVPPEVWEGGAATAMGDQYALGVTGFVCMTRELPYSGKTPLEVLDAIRSTSATIRARVADVDPELEAVILKAMARKVEDRHPTVADFDEALRLLAERRGFATKPPTGSSALEPPSGAVAVPPLQTPTPIPVSLPPLQPPEPSEPPEGGGPPAVQPTPEPASIDEGSAVGVAAMEHEANPAPAGHNSDDHAAAAAAFDDAASFNAAASSNAAAVAAVFHAAVAAVDAAAGLKAPTVQSPTTAITGEDLADAEDPLTVASAAVVLTAEPTIPATGFDAESAERTALVDRKRVAAAIAADEAAKTVAVPASLAAIMPAEDDEPIVPPSRGFLPMVIAGLAGVAVILVIIILARSSADDVARPAPPATPVAVPPVEASPPPPAEPPPPPSTDTSPPTGELTLDDLEAPPPPPDPAVSIPARLSTAALDAVVAAASKKGIRTGDVATLDAAVVRGRSAARAGDKDGLESATKAARIAADGTTIDKAFVSDKLARFNKAFDGVKNSDVKAKVQPIAREVLRHLSKGEWVEANQKLNIAFITMKKGR